MVWIRDRYRQILSTGVIFYLLALDKAIEVLSRYLGVVVDGPQAAESFANTVGDAPSTDVTKWMLGLAVIGIIWVPWGQWLDRPSRKRSSLEDFATDERPIATRHELCQKRLYRRTLHIFDVPRDARDNLWIDDVMFDECNIVGPAVIFLSDSSLMHECVFGIADDDPQSIQWPVKVGKEKLGAIGLRKARFTKCNFSSIGFANPELAGVIVEETDSETTKDASDSR